MTALLLPRLEIPAAAAILAEHEEALLDGATPAQLAHPTEARARVNDTGGRAPSTQDLIAWREHILKGMDSATTLESVQEKNRHSARLGRLLEEIIRPLPADAGHDGAWSFVTLCLIPDLVHARWPRHEDGTLPRDRWIGAQVGRDRNYAKNVWRRWTILGELTFHGDPLLGEDEYGGLFERTALARDRRIAVAAAGKVLAFDQPGSRSKYARALMRRITWNTGSRLLDVLSDAELEHLVDEASVAVLRGLDTTPRRSRD